MRSVMAQSIKATKRRKAGNLTADRLRSVLRYQAGTGLFYWLPRSRDEFSSERAFAAFNGRNAGKLAGSDSGHGYIQIRVDDIKYWAHRLAWLYATGAWPQGDIDHINGDGTDNRIDNLRDVGVIVNNQNERRARRNNKLGVLGVHCRGSKFAASIMSNRVVHRLGLFATAAEASAAYVRAKRQLHEGCTL